MLSPLLLISLSLTHTQFTRTQTEAPHEDRRLEGGDCGEPNDDGHDHRALLEFEKKMNSRSITSFEEDVMMHRKLSSDQELADQFSVRAAQSGALVGGPETTFLNGVMLVDFPEETKMGSKVRTWRAKVVIFPIQRP